jgi:hypothetical protein
MADLIPPIDTSVVLPPSVLRAAEAANALHAASYKTDPQPQPQPQEPAPQPQPQEPAPQPQPQEPAPQPQPQEPAPQPQPQSQPQPVDDSNVSPEQWQHRYLSMKGRFEQSQVTLGTMQEQMSELGDELQRTQQAINRPRQQPQQQQPQPQRLLTDQDVQTYGPELLDVIQRAAREAIAPDLNTVRQQTSHVSQQLTKQGTAGLYQQLDAHVPTWKEINVNPRFRSWCRSSDVYSGQVRGKLLNAAFQAADAPRVVAFFQGFLNEEVATGQVSGQQQPAAAIQAPRQAALSLDALAAPGRAKPATGDNPASSADKPVFTLAQIKNFYSKPVRDSYVGRDADRLRDEQSIFLAQREGRVR